VATILRRLYAPKNTVTNGLQDPALDQIAQGVRKKVAPAVPKLANNEFLPPLPKPGSEGIDRQPTQRGLAPPSGEDITPNFEADEGINAVIVQGRGDRMAEYEALIQRLDKKPQLVELEATIIEVSSDSVNALGVDWSMRGRNGSSVSLTAPPTSITPFTLSTVIANAGRELLARVNALQGEGKARVLSKPLVLGVANRAAVMREKRVASVRVASREDANLFQIEAGTLLEMTPQVTTSEGGVNNIKLSLYIEDGNFETASVDQVPIVKKTEIRTEAHVKEGESLLIGGITVESDQSNFAGVPGVSRLPLVGGLFRNREHQTMRMERMFLITPRVLDSEVSARRDAEPKAPTEPAKAVARGTTGAAALGVVTVPALSAPMADAAVQANTSLYVN
jgi:type III secretion protein C